MTATNMCSNFGGFRCSLPKHFCFCFECCFVTFVVSVYYSLAVEEKRRLHQVSADRWRVS